MNYNENTGSRRAKSRLKRNAPSFLDSVSADQRIQHRVHILTHIFNEYAIAVCYCTFDGIQISLKQNTQYNYTLPAYSTSI